MQVTFRKTIKFNQQKCQFCIIESKHDDNNDANIMRGKVEK